MVCWSLWGGITQRSKKSSKLTLCVITAKNEQYLSDRGKLMKRLFSLWIFKTRQNDSSLQLQGISQLWYICCSRGAEIETRQSKGRLNWIILKVVQMQLHKQIVDGGGSKRVAGPLGDSYTFIRLSWLKTT